MADTLTRRSPVARLRISLRAPAGVRQPSPRSRSSRWSTSWVDPSGPGGAAAAEVLGVDALPTTPSTIVSGRRIRGDLARAAGMAGHLGRAAPVKTSRRRCARSMSEHGGAAVDVSAQRTTMRLRGAHARDVIAKGCSLDLHPAVFGPGAAAQTMLGQAGVVLIPLSDNGTDYRIIVRSSFARYLADWLIDAAEEFGVDW